METNVTPQIEINNIDHVDDGLYLVEWQGLDGLPHISEIQTTWDHETYTRMECVADDVTDGVGISLAPSEVLAAAIAAECRRHGR